MLPLIAAAHAAVPDFGSCPFPEGLERLDLLPHEALVPALERWRGARPELFGATQPPSAPRAVADFTPREALHVVMPDFEEGQDAVARLVRAALPHARIVVHRMVDVRWIEAHRALRRQLVDPTAVEWVDDALSSSWLRDFGATWVIDGGRRVAVDHRYVLDCLAEDAWPTRAASSRSWEVVRSPLRLDGGNVLTDGHGTCFTTTAGQGYWHEDVAGREEAFRTWMGCTRTIWVESMPDDETGHVDMLLSLADEHTVLLASADRATWPNTFASLERVAAQLSATTAADGEFYRVIRVPLAAGPAAWTEGQAPTVEAATPRPELRSYLNLVPLNGAVLVPSYAEAGPVEQQAIEAIRRAFPGREVLPIPADAFAVDGGALHCMTWTVPAG